MQPSRILALTAAFFGASPVLADALSGDAAPAGLTERTPFCPTCTVNLRTDGNAVLYDESTQQTVGTVALAARAEDYADLFEQAPVRRGPYSGGVTAAARASNGLFQRASDACNARKCQKRSDCGPCELGCSKGKCWMYMGIPSFCARNCKAWRRSDGELLVTREDTGAVIGTVSLFS